MLVGIAIGELVLWWILWVMVFVVQRRRGAGGKAVVTAPAARRGIILQGVAFAVVWSFSPISLGWREWWPVGFTIASMILGPASVALAWFAIRHLGKQWRIQAALSEDHELILTGPYRWIRHPVYASMLGMLLATGFAWSWWPLLLAALVIFLAGTEIRVRAEDGLLAARFGESFVAYRSRVRAYIPFLR
jgi:protein-S-isoprenylcysteine O-methyltransferase Ste14